MIVENRIVSLIKLQPFPAHDGFRVSQFWFIAPLPCCGSGITNIHDCLILHGMTDLRNKVGLVRKALFTGNPILASRFSRPIGIIGRIGAEVGGKNLPNLVIVSSRFV
jgi:hypothetical protein